MADVFGTIALVLPLFDSLICDSHRKGIETLPRRTKGFDFESTRASMGGGEPSFSGVWEIFENYEIRKLEDGHHYWQATGEVKRKYRPLADTPCLFLDLARLWDGPHNREAIDRWLGEYGLLGLHYDDNRPYVPEYYPDPATPPLMYFTDGGSREGVGDFWRCAEEANRTLLLYEATLNRDRKELEDVLGGPRVVRSIVRSYVESALQVSLQAGAPTPKSEILSTEDLLVDKALMHVWHVVQDKLSNFAYPAINHELPRMESLPHLHEGGNPFTPHQLGAAWGFRNLLGAAYLQFYWLITSRADIKRCENCGRIIPLASPDLLANMKRRKPRSDKKYCNKSCQQQHDYKVRGKPKREARKGPGA